MYRELKRIVFGAPIASCNDEEHKLTVPLGLAVFSADALSSTAYATDEILIALSASAAYGQVTYLSIPVALTIMGLIALVVISYRQVIKAYPEGGGTYNVAKQNLGKWPSLLAASAILIDYVLTVAVSISAGIAAITSTGLIAPHAAVLFCILAVLFIALMNLRGLKESGIAFAFPAYTFLASLGVLITMGLFQIWQTPTLFNHLQFTATQQANFSDIAVVFLFLKAFSHGCAGLTGIEAVADGVKAFKAPSAPRANSTLMIMGILLSSIFFGITLLALSHGIHPVENQTILSQVAFQVFGGKTPPYYFVQFSTMIMLILAANTAFADFPRVANLLAHDGFLPRQLMSIGDRLVFNNGIMILSLLSILLIMLYHGDTHALIPLYAVGVFISFTTSQTGMVVYHLRERKPGWQTGMLINGLGGLVTAFVTMLLTYEKFTEGAWIICVAIPLLMLVFKSIHRHYQSVSKQLRLEGDICLPTPQGHRVMILVSSISRGTLPAIQYAQSLAKSCDMLEAIHVELNPITTENLKKNWALLNVPIKLTILEAPFRSVTEPILDYMEHLDAEQPNVWTTIVVPEFVTKKLWHNLLHNQTAILLKTLLRFRKNKIVSTVRFHLDE
jgi:amino acid transporter